MLDLHNLALAGFVSQVTFTLTLTLLAWSDRRSIGTRWLAGACGLELLGTALHPLVEGGADPVLRGLDRALLVVVMYLLYLGLRWFAVRRPIPNATGPILVGAAVVVIATAALRSVGAALALSRVASLVVMSFALAALLRVRYSALRRSAAALAILVGAFIVLLTFRLSLDLGLLGGGVFGEGASNLQPVVRGATVVIFSLLAFSSVAIVAAESKRRLHQESREDALTGMPNRRFLEEMAEREIRRAQRGHRSLTLLMLDVDHFKKLNDTFGHNVGDRALRNVGRTLLDLLGPADYGARLGGEEFAVLLPGRDLEDAAFLGERLRRGLEALRLPSSEGLVTLTVSIGVSQLAAGETEWESMLRRADKALYQAKREGRNRVVLWSASRDGHPASREGNGADGLWKRQLSG